MTVNISHNVVYKTTKLVSDFEENAVPICPLQGYQLVHPNCKYLQLNNISCKFLLLHNTEMISKVLSTELLFYVNNKCTWLKGSIFQKLSIQVNTIYNTIIKYNNTFVNRNTTKRVIPLTVCPCSNNSSYNCFMAHVYSIFPGQILHLNLKIAPPWYYVYNYSKFVAANTIDDDCSIVDGSQLSQT